MSVWLQPRCVRCCMELQDIAGRSLMAKNKTKPEAKISTVYWIIKLIFATVDKAKSKDYMGPFESVS